jgi:2-methylisocitrate lyase-like PEP mutase family enzyme
MLRALERGPNMANNAYHPGRALRTALAKPGLITAPGVYDMISAKIADELGFDALYMTGYGVSASLGLPDAGLASYTEMVSRVAQICQGTSTPVICDADTGFGGLLNVERTVKGYEAAGAAAIQIEDQVFPKRCGHTPGRRVVPIEDMVRKIKVAAASRTSPDFLIVARTDARTRHGLDEALRRGEAFAEAGADVLFIESPESEAEMARIGKHFDKPLLANMADGGRTPILPKQRLEELGYRIAIFPATGFLATAKALAGVYGVLKDKGSSDTLASEFYPFDKFCRLVGFDHVWEFEKRWPEV